MAYNINSKYPAGAPNLPGLDFENGNDRSWRSIVSNQLYALLMALQIEGWEREHKYKNYIQLYSQRSITQTKRRFYN